MLSLLNFNFMKYIWQFLEVITRHIFVVQEKEKDNFIDHYYLKAACN